MTIIKEEKNALKKIEENLTVKQNCLEKQKLEFDGNKLKKEHFITKVRRHDYIILYVFINEYYLIGRRIKKQLRKSNKTN